MSKYQASGTLTYSNGDSVSVPVVSSGLAHRTYRHCAQRRGQPGRGSWCRFILSECSQRIFLLPSTLSYLEYKALYRLAVLPAEHDYSLSLMATEHLLPFMRPPPPPPPHIFVSNVYVLYPPVGGAWRPTIVLPLVDLILPGVSKPSKAADEMCCNENSSVCLCVVACVLLHSVITL